MTSSNNKTLLHRRQLIAGSLLVIVGAAIPPARSASRMPPRVLFICQFGTVKSAIARELLKRRAAARGISVIVSSRGITPEAHLAPSTRSQLLAEGIDLDGERLQKLRRADLGNADLVVAFNPLPASMRKKGLRDWSAVPSVNDTYSLARADLDRRIDQLLDYVSQMRR